MGPLLAPHARADRTFERMYQRHVGDVYRYALAVLRNPADAEDVAQTTFLNAYRAFQRGERPRNPQNWLIAIAHNVCRQRFRQSARRPEEVEYDDAIGDALPEEERGPSAEDIQRALGHLAFNQRAALVMRELEGRSYAEIAEILDTTVSAVETLIFRARRALREQLEGSLTCGEAERAISRQLDGRLARAERGALRAHLRECKECDRFARSQRAQRTAIKALAAIPIPSSLTGLFGGGAAAAAGGGVAMKAAAFVAAGTIATGVGYEGARQAGMLADDPGPAAVALERAAPAAAPALAAAADEPPPNAHRPVSGRAAERGRAGARSAELRTPPGQARKAAKPGAAAGKSSDATKARSRGRTNTGGPARSRPERRVAPRPKPSNARTAKPSRPSKPPRATERSKNRRDGLPRLPVVPELPDLLPDSPQVSSP